MVDTHGTSSEVLRDTDQPFTTASALDYRDDHNTVDFGPAVDGRLQNCDGPALACTHLRTSKLRIREVDIRMNTRYEWWSGIRQVPADRRSHDLWSLAAHEFGHGLNIAHVTEDREDSDPLKRGALMFPTFAPGATRRYLTGYDWNALCDIQRC